MSGRILSASSDATTDQSQESQYIAEFRLLRPLGKGAMGEVFLALDTFLDRYVAVKLLTAGETSTSARERFYIEARAVARLQHPNVVTLYRAGEDAGRRYLVSEFVRGQSLERWKKPMPWRQVLDVGLGLARGLAAAHRRGVLHRDIKPANVILTKGGEVKILDFGLAKLAAVQPAVAPTETASGRAEALVSSQTEVHAASLDITKSGALLGTPLYMPPETWRGEQATTQSDVYSLGALLYELCSGRPPHQADTAAALGFRVIGVDATPLATVVSGIEPRLAAIVDKCLQRDPTKRFASGEEVHAALLSLTAIGPSVSRGLALAGATLLLLALATVVGVAISRDRQARKQAELSQRLGQEIAAMEWLLRSARQMPLHNLEREKEIVRQRMGLLQTELAGYGPIASGLGHYALGRGHMALHEYPQALAQLQQAVALGVHSPEVHYALGVVLGKHFEQAMNDARLSGGGNWAQKQLKELEPLYLAPAIASLQRSRSMKFDAPQYLEGLIAYYQRDYGAALRQSEAALRKTPWLYEANKLAGDVHLEQALQARDHGHTAEAEREFAGAVKSYEAAAAVGQSDGEVYEGLAESWIRQIEMANDGGLSCEEQYARAVAASGKLMDAEPDSIAGPLKKAFAVALTVAAGPTSEAFLASARQCLDAAELVLKKQPGHPYASDAAALCQMGVANAGRARGEDPEPALRKALSLLEPAVKKFPRFLWGLNDMGNLEQALGAHLQLHGNPSAKEMLQEALAYSIAASELDPTFVRGLTGVLWNLVLGIVEAHSDEEIRGMLAKADTWMSRCQSINGQFQQCFNNAFQIYTRAASRALQAGQDPQPRLKQGLAYLSTLRKLGGSLQDAEQHAVFAALIDAQDRLRRGQDPAPALAELEANLPRCFAGAAQDAMCRTLAAQAEWVWADWAVFQKRPSAPLLEGALTKAVLATQSPETYPDAWQTLAETHLRLAQAQQKQPEVRDQHIDAGLSAVEKVFGINPNHAQGRATMGTLLVARAQATAEVTSRQLTAQSAVQALKLALTTDPFLTHDYAPILESAQMLAQVSN